MTTSLKPNTILRDNIIRLYQEKDYPLSNGVNICGIRATNQIANKFDDVLIAFNKEQFIVVKGTTDPGLYYLNNPLSVLGTAILPDGFHQGLWIRGLHRGKYDALIQNKPCRVIRDADKNNILNYTISQNAKLVGGVSYTYEHALNAWNKNTGVIPLGISKFVDGNRVHTIEVGYFGINFHKSNANNDEANIGQYSAGCQVVLYPKDFDNILAFIYADKIRSFSYALFNQDDYDRV